MQSAPENGSKEPKGRSWTVSIAVAGSIVDNTQSLELASLISGQIARAAAIFNVDEIVVYDDSERSAKLSAKSRKWKECAADTGGVFLARLLQFLETPQYLRKSLYSVHVSLKYAGMLPPIDPPHHLRQMEWLPYREGVVVEKRPDDGGSFVNVGIVKDVRISQFIKAGTRVTVAMGDDPSYKKLYARKLKAVPPTEPREKSGLYWGFSVRLASSLSGVFTECPFEDGYDYTIGTSEHGEQPDSSDLVIPSFKHLLIVFGGVTGLEHSLKEDDNLEIEEVSYLFDRYINVCPDQGSRTIRTEEAILIALQFFKKPIQRSCSKR
ncbi:methyltransferase [Marchantia polymorpha subsp. ruderalis]|uniref:RNA methyltransferase n=2 Tax=Marchantia polymorpha TaxID=3197 RepID=A0AAF6B2L6_MARPO|nr:hypothetical protein MARPO_0049s0075 [Marchantia polymorpha]BBN06250.1 hypothetical protein Mp_3g19590 [Marchantia polymorpha subsp. ruderalis]|eukprot:PTQ38793.1 hypothetical protein MARPO_0049s0075 [Marchantia polymorpha]